MVFPKYSQWKQLFKVLKGTERNVFFVLFILSFLSAIYLINIYYLKNTVIIPNYGGTYTEGIIGQPRFINPIYGETNDIDRTLLGLVYSGLMTYDNNGKITNDLVENYEISENGKKYTFHLKDNIFWQDGVKITTKDVIFTLKTIKNSDYKSHLRANWLNVEIEEISEKSITFHLGSAYNAFLENCTFKILPKHIWEGVLAENFALSVNNLQPIGSGPYIISELQDNNDNFIKSITLNSNPRYYGKKPYISKITFKFFSNKNELISSANKKTIEGFSIIDAENNSESIDKIRQGWTKKDRFKVYGFSLPRYFAVLFNTSPSSENSKITSDTNITKALNYAVNKQELIIKINELFKERSFIVNSPILPDYYNYSDPKINYTYDINEANILLDKAGYKLSSEGIRSKPNDKKPAFQFKNYLSSKSKGEEVVKLQECLSKIDENFKNTLSSETSGTYGEPTEKAVSAFQEKYMSDIKSTGEVGTSTRKKLNEMCFSNTDNLIPLRFNLTTINQKKLIETANLLKEYWQNVGVIIDIKIVELSEIKDIIKNRRYDALLYGQAFGVLPDLYPFWHSTQIKDPGLNFSSYQNKTADQLLKEAREVQGEQEKIKKYEALQDVILQDAPALFLYNPEYPYWVSEKIKGIDTLKIVDPAKRFINIINWHINTKRVWK